MKIIMARPRLRLMIPMVAACLIGAIAFRCGSKDASTGVAQLDDNNPIIANIANSENVPETETARENLPKSTPSTEDISDSRNSQQI